jgi:uncharacterized protein YlxP (DUF503 family)
VIARHRRHQKGGAATVTCDLSLKSALIRVNPRYAFLFTMPIAYLTMELRIEGAHSLKDKRQVVRSLKDRLRNSFNISIAEIDVTDLWQRATLGVVSISGSRDYLEGLMRNVEQAAARQANNLGAEVVDSFTDFVELGESTEANDSE